MKPRPFIKKRIGLCYLSLGIPIMPSRTLAAAVCLACLLVPASAREGVSRAAREWVAAVVGRIEETSRLGARTSAAGKIRRVEIRLRVDRDGSVLGVEVERAATNVVEKRVRAAVAAAAPFEPPPGELLAADGSTELSFPLELGRR